MILVWMGCLLPQAQGTHETAPGDDSAVDTGDGPTDDLEADDARVRALTGLPEGDDPCAEPELIRVEYTVDGDTFYGTVEGSGEFLNVRMIGVDTPEVAHESGEVADCYANEAWTFSATQLDGRLAWLTYDADCEDDFGRRLAYVVRDEGETGFFNRRLAREGWARALEIAPNDSYADEIADDEAAARQEERGLWGECAR